MGPGYCATRESTVSSVTPCTVPCATVRRGPGPANAPAAPGARENGVREAPRKTRTTRERENHGELKGKCCGRNARKGLNPGQTETIFEQHLGGNEKARQILGQPLFIVNVVARL